jgi:hypothetical protein
LEIETMSKDIPAFIVIGHAGNATIHYKPRHECGAVITGKLEAYPESAEVKAAIAAGVRGYDMRPMTIDAACEMALRGPMYDYDGAWKNSGAFDYEGRETLDDCGYGSMDYAPAETLLMLAARRGAAIIN